MSILNRRGPELLNVSAQVKFGRTRRTPGLPGLANSATVGALWVFLDLKTGSTMEAVRLLLCILSVFLVLVSERFVVLAAFSQALDSDFTFTLPAGRKECFFQTMKKDASLEIEYQVTKCFTADIISCQAVTLAK